LGVIGHLREIMWWVVLPQYPPSARWLSPFIARPTDFGHTLVIIALRVVGADVDALILLDL